MNKKLFLSMFAASMLFATSCSNDELEVVQSGNEAQVSFSLGLEGAIGSRAISDGKSADVLMYAVFDKYDQRISTINKVSKTGVTFPTTENITLAKGQTYKVAFWAQDDDCEAYTVSDDMKVTVDYKTNNKSNNDETRDAFFKTVEFTVTGSTSIDVELKRPFAQINVGVTTADWDAAVASGITIAQSSVVIKNAATNLNLLDGTVSGETEVNYSLANIPAKTEILKVDTDGDGTEEEYKWLSMSYILPENGDKKTTLDNVAFVFAPENSSYKNIEFNQGLNAVPVQRNWRTNILGKILTGDIQFNITIDPVYDNDINYPNGSAQELELAAKMGGSVTLTENVELTAPLEVVADMVLDLNGYTITTTEKEVGRHHYAINNRATMILKGESGSIKARGIQNFGTMTIDGDITITNVDTNGGAAVWNEGSITINGGTFTTNDQAGAGSYGVALNTRANGTAIVNGGNYIAYSQLSYAIVNEGTTTINDAMVKGKHGAVSGSETNDATVINGGTFELMENPSVSDHCTYYCSDIRGGKFTLGNNTDSGAKVFYNSTIADGFKSVENKGIYYVVANDVIVATKKEELATALTAVKEKINVVLLNDIDLPIASLGQITPGSGEYKLGGENTKNITIDLNGKKLNITTTYWSNLGAKNDKALFTIKNGTMTSSQATGTWNSYDVTFSNCDYVIENVVFEKAIAFDNTGKSVSLKDVTINETHDYYAMWITAAGQNVTIDGLTINSAAGRGIKIDEQYVDAPKKVTLNINNATFKTAKKAAIVVKSAAGAEINASNLNIDGVAEDKKSAVWVDEDASAYADLVIVNGASKSVEGTVAKN